MWFDMKWEKWNVGDLFSTGNGYFGCDFVEDIYYYDDIYNGSLHFECGFRNNPILTQFGSWRRFQWYAATYMWVSSQVSLKIRLKAYPGLSQSTVKGMPTWNSYAGCEALKLKLSYL